MAGLREARARPCAVDESLLSRYEGEYELPGAMTVAVRLEGERLVGRLPEGDETELLPLSETAFVVDLLGTDWRFRIDAAGVCTGAVYVMGSRELSARKRR